MLIRLIHLLFLISAATKCYGSSYVITTPQVWPAGLTSQVCISLMGDILPSDHYNVSVVDSSVENGTVKEIDLVPQFTLDNFDGASDKCKSVEVPETFNASPMIKVKAQVGNETKEHTGKVIIQKNVASTFVETDKYLYKPGQTVKFRILTIKGPGLQVSTKPYAAIFIENPQGTRIAQWLDVDHQGLVHLEFELSEEPEEGMYKINVETSNGQRFKRSFKVEEFVLPRFSVEIKPPPRILAHETNYSYTVCATYTYGQPVKGELTFTAKNDCHGCKNEYSVSRNVSGCETILFATKDLVASNVKLYGIKAEATFTERDTSIRFEAKPVTTHVPRRNLRIEYVGTETYYKPGLPFTAMFKITLPDSTGAAHKPMKVCVAWKCKEFLTDKHGFLKFIIPPHLQQRINIETVTYPSYNKIRKSHYMKNLYSPSNSSLIILTKDQNKIKCSKGENIKLDIPIMFSLKDQNKTKLHVMVVARGQVQFMKTQEYQLRSSLLQIDSSLLIEPIQPPESNMKVGIMMMPINLPTTVSPKAKVLAWVIRDDGEVVSDSQQIDIENCLENDVELDWGTEEVKPGEQTTLSLKAHPFSLCSLGVVDKSVELMSSTNSPLSTHNIFKLLDEISGHGYSQIDNIEYCFKKIDYETTIGPSGSVFPKPFDNRSGRLGTIGTINIPYYNTRPDYFDAIKMFDETGLNVFSNQILETRPCRPTITIPGTQGSSVIMHGTQGSSVTIPGTQGSPVTIPSTSGSSVPNPDATTANIETNKVRTYFPETWLWMLLPLNENAVNNQTLTMPDTITTWIGRAVCVHPEKGVGISGKASITTFTPFFVDLTLPPSVKREEILPVVISTFNYEKETLPVKIILHPSEEYDILKGQNSTEVAKGQSAAGIYSDCILSQDKNVHSIRIRPKVIGNVNLTIEAFIDPEASCTRDENGTNILGKSLGITKRDHIIKPIKVEAEGFPMEKTFTQYICSKDLESKLDSLQQWDLTLPDQIVEQSERAFVTVVGDLLGPSIDNLGHLVKMPTGCGEQNMLKFAPNIFVMQYLDASAQTTEEVANKAIGFMKKGYQRELNYRHNDGSFSAFGKSDASGSTWLTAFVVKSFAQARQYIGIDLDDLSMSKDWLKRQQLENGCFQSVGKVLHQGMKGGGSDSSGPVFLTSYVMISLLESGASHDDRAIVDGVFCLKAVKDVDVYAQALRTYAYALAKLPLAEAEMNKLLKMGEQTSNSLKWTGVGDAVAVEIGGYAILAMTTLNPEFYFEQIIKVVKWISSQRNGQGGFISTQDTVVALQALASFEQSQSQGPVNLTITVEAEGLKESLHIDQTNKLLQQKVDIEHLPNTVSLNLDGEGCSLVQAVLRYNVPNKDASETFSLNVTTSTAFDKACKTKTIKACASYLVKGQTSNMAVLEFTLPSGYIPDKNHLKRLVSNGIFKRYEVDGSKLNFYIDELYYDSVACAQFDIIREILIENAKPGTVNLYDYYRPEFSVREKFTLPSPNECITDSFPEVFPAISIPIGDLVDALEDRLP